ncbi:MAG: hypothetical protein ACTHU0_21795 [Kofleriaceae bacterium]
MEQQTQKFDFLVTVRSTPKGMWWEWAYYGASQADAERAAKRIFGTKNVLGVRQVP